MNNLNLFNQPPLIHGSNYVEELDEKRLTGQMLRVFNYMRNEAWRTLFEIADAIVEPESSISAQMRHLRKDRNGKHEVQKRRRGNPKSGIWEYRLKVNHNSNGYTP